MCIHCSPLFDFSDIGKYFGYPDCCIHAFNQRATQIITTRVDPMTPEQKLAHDGSGFIPCPECAKKVVNGEIKLQDLIRDRKHSHPFPIEDEEEFNRDFPIDH